ncbi:MAG: hypothetical protein M1374_06905 [Firmicutes bacterium]|nr:hypothetical protein [Bacillota bacterium]
MTTPRNQGGRVKFFGISYPGLKILTGMGIKRMVDLMNSLIADLLAVEVCHWVQDYNVKNKSRASVLHQDP